MGKMQERPKGVRTSLKLWLSFSIHAKTSKGEKFCGGNLGEMFSEFSMCLVKVWRPQRLFLTWREAIRVFNPRYMHTKSRLCVHGQYLHMQAHVCARRKAGQTKFSLVLSMFSPQIFSYESYSLKNCSWHNSSSRFPNIEDQE